MSKRRSNLKAKHFGGSGVGQSNVTTGWRYAKPTESANQKPPPKREVSDTDKAAERFILALILSGILFVIFK